MTKLLRSTGRLWLLFAAFLTAQGAWAQVSIAPGGLTYTQNFNTLPSSGTANAWTNNVTLPGWLSTQTTFRASTGSDNAGSLYSFGSSGATDRALGSVASGSAAPRYGVILTNNTGTTLSSLQIAYTGEQWRNGGNVNAQKLTFVYATGTNLTIDELGSNVAALDFTSPVTSPASNTASSALDGNLPANQVSLSSTITFATPLADGQQILLKWTDINDTGNDHGLGIDDLTVTAVTAGPPLASLSANPTTLTGFVATQGAVSNVQTYTVSGSTLDGNPVSVSATANIELSTTAGGTFTPTLSLPAAGSAISQTIYARLTGAAPTGAFSGTITNTANGTLTASVTVSGQVNTPNAPALTASPTTLSSFTTSQGTVSAEKTYTLTAANLTAPIAVSAPAGVEVSQTSGSGFGSSLTLPVSTTSAVVYVHLTGGGAAGNVSGTITNTSGSLTANVAVSGTVSSTAPIGAYTPIATARAGINSTFTIAGRVTVSNQLGSRQIYIQDATGGIAIYSGPSGPDFSTLVNIGDSVQVRGPVTVFSGYLELTGTGNFTAVAGAGSRVPTPVAITPNQLANYQGQLVSITNATLTPVAASFTGGTNYTITAGGTSGILRISANSPLAGAGQPANPVSVTGIADRFVSGATTVGNDALQLQPRILADIPGSTPATDLTCTIGSGSTLALDKTLDIAAWNFEFFGADAGVISCPDGKTLAYANFGPTNEALQQSNATSVLTKLNADIISAEEISDINRFDAAVKAMPGSYSYICSNRFSYYFQNECDQVPSGNPSVVFGPTKYAQKVCVIYNTATVTPVLAETKALLDGKYNYPSANNWSSGRLPFLFVANVTINGQTQKIHVVALHAKSGSATADYNRRKQDIIDLKAELDANYANANIVILGDYNDKLNGSIAAGQPSSYQPFVTDAVNYSAITLPLENQGCSTFNSSASFIDHFIVSNELAKAYVSNSAYVLQPFSIPNYGNTTSDHNPIVSRYDLSQFVSPVTALSLTASATPTTLLTTGTTTLSATVSGGTTPYSYTFSGPGTITPSGNTASVANLPAGVQTFTVVAKDATSPTSQTISTTVSVTVTAPAPVITSLSLTASATPTTLLTTGTTTLSATVSGGTTPYSYTFSGPGTITPSGNSAGVANLPAGVQTFTVVAKDATSPTSQTISTTVSVTVTAPAPVVTSLSLTVSATPTTLLTTGTTTLSATVAGGTTPYSYTFTGPGTITSSGNTASVANLPAGIQMFTVVAKDATAPTSQTISATVSVTVTAPAPTGPATLTITSFNCFSTNGALSSVNFVVGYSDGTFTPALPNLFINGVTVTGQLGQSYSFGFDANAMPVPIQDNASRSTYFVWNFRQACAGPVTLPATTPPVAPALPNQMATQGTFLSYVVPAFAGTAPIAYAASGLPAGLNFDANSRTISGTPSTTGVSTVVVSASNSAGQSSGQFTITVSASATQPTGPATLTITSFNCFSTNGALSSVNFVVGYSDGTVTPTLPNLFINGVTASGQLGQSYSFGFDANAMPVPIQDNASRSTYFVWNFRAACATRPVNTRLAAEPVAPLHISVLGNPVRHTVEVDVTGADGGSLNLLLTDAQGRVLGQRQIDKAVSTEKVLFNVNNQPTGILLLRAVTPTQTRTIRVLKAD